MPRIAFHLKRAAHGRYEIFESRDGQTPVNVKPPQADVLAGFQLSHAAENVLACMGAAKREVGGENISVQFEQGAEELAAEVGRLLDAVPEGAAAHSVREVRLLAGWRDRLLRLCKLAFSKRDASLYLFPYAPTGRFFCGGAAFAEAEVSDTFNFAEGLEGEQPKLSIHASGQVHVVTSQRRVGPLQTLPLSDWRGEHIASVTFDRLEGLSPVDGAANVSGPERDVTIPFEDDVESARVLLYLNGAAPVFPGEPECRFVVTLRRPSLESPVYLCAKVVSQPPLGQLDHSGVIVLAGWNPQLPRTAPQDYLYVRGL